MLGGGAALLALDNSPYKDDCDGDNRDFEGRCRYRYNTLLPGALLTGVGIASIITGISTGLVAYGRRRNAQPKHDDMEEDTISVRPLIGPTHAGLEVRF